MILYIAIQFVSLILLAPLFDGFLKRCKAFFNGRKGPSLFQTYYDFAKLFQKELLINKHTSFITRLAPIAIFAIFGLTAMFVPVVGSGASLNLIYLFYLFAFGTFFLVLYGMDNSTYFGGLGGARELFLAFLLEPIIIVLTALFFSSFHAIDVAGLSHNIASSPLSAYDSFLLCVLAFAFFVVLIGENTRFPFDNPATHLELTMIHEAMLLETTGPSLGLIEYAAKIKLMTFFTLFIDLFVPFTYGFQGIGALWCLWFAKMLIGLLVLALFEVYITKLRIFRYQNFTGTVLMLLVLLFVFKLFFL